jgi:hypothetical protein
MPLRSFAVLIAAVILASGLTVALAFAAQPDPALLSIGMMLASLLLLMFRR